MRIPLFLFILIVPVLLYSQNDEVKLKLAQEFFQNKEYEKSIDLFEDVFKKNQSAEVYLALVNNYLILERYSDAEKTVKKQLKKHPDDALYQVDYGFVLIAMGEDKKGIAAYNDAIKNLPPNTSTILALSASFQRRNEIAYSIETLKKGKKLTGNFYGYEFELGELYFQSGNISAMVDEYLDLIEKNEAYLQNVQNALNTSIYHTPKKENLDILNQTLLKRIQRNPEKEIFSELLIWHYLQQKDFAGAIRQSKALDKRNKENGYRFIDLGNSCKSNEEYELAQECFQFVIDKGPSNQNYISARILMTETLKEKITSAPFTQEDLLILELNYVNTLQDIGTNGATISLQIGLAEVRAFYLNKPTEAIDMLEKALNQYQLTPENKAKCKLLLADIYLAQNEIWEASLLYSQVEKDFKYEPLGDLAKFKNARIYFFTGDFSWSKAQLDILKGSTSKLIANDAMRLSLLISDNLAFDTSGEALKMYSLAYLNFEQNKYDEALQSLNKMMQIYVAHNIIDEVYFLRYEVFLKKQDFESAASSLEKIASDYASDILADEALYRLALLYENYLEKTDQAMDCYKRVFTNYPASIYVVDSRNRFRKMRGDDIN